MSRAEEKALKAYPDDMGTLAEVKYISRLAYKKGYEQAIKDAAEWFKEALSFGCHPCNGNGLVMQFKNEMEQ